MRQVRGEAGGTRQLVIVEVCSSGSRCWTLAFFNGHFHRQMLIFCIHSCVASCSLTSIMAPAVGGIMHME